MYRGAETKTITIGSRNNRGEFARSATAKARHPKEHYFNLYSEGAISILRDSGY
jgi:hypothetical protein